MDKVDLVVPGKPMGKQRVRVTRKGIAYTPKKTVNYETLIKYLYIEKYGDKVLEGPIRAIITAYMFIPKSTSKKRRKKMLEGKILPTKKPDWDNIGKITTDALSGIAYRDDNQIVDGRVVKQYGETPCVQIVLKSIGE